MALSTTSALPLAFAALAALGLLALPSGARATSVDEPSKVAEPGVPLSAAFYNDASCLLTINAASHVGTTLIDANLDENASRMLVHCDTRDGRRLTLLARGERLQRDTRMALLPREGIEGGSDGVIAWLTRAGTSFADESAPRRYVAPGRVIIRELPAMQIDGQALNGDRTAFARVAGRLEKLLSHPGGGEMSPTPDCAPTDERDAAASEGSAECQP